MHESVKKFLEFMSSQSEEIKEKAGKIMVNYSGLPVKYKSLTISKNEMRVLSAVTKYGLRKQ